MAHDRYDARGFPRDENARWRDERYEPRGSREERGFFERAGDEVASWFGDEDAERRRRRDQRMMEREGGYGRTWRGEENRGFFGGDRDENRSRSYGQSQSWDRGRFDRDEERSSGPMSSERGYRPMVGDYGRGSDRSFAASGYGRDRGWREPEPYGRDEGTSFGGSTDRSRDHDPHYRSWRHRHMSELDRDYESYRRENQERFESDFGTWRERRMAKRGLLGQIREHMEVVGSDDEHVGTVDRAAGERLILTKSDPESGGVHHSLSCSEIDRIEGDRVILDLTAEQARQRWRDESRERALFEREDQGEMGPRMLDRSFEGTYR
jgi:hypothetical protein